MKQHLSSIIVALATIFIGVSLSGKSFADVTLNGPELAKKIEKSLDEINKISTSEAFSDKLDQAGIDDLIEGLGNILYFASVSRTAARECEDRTQLMEEANQIYGSLSDGVAIFYRLTDEKKAKFANVPAMNSLIEARTYLEYARDSVPTFKNLIAESLDSLEIFQDPASYNEGLTSAQVAGNLTDIGEAILLLNSIIESKLNKGLLAEDQADEVVERMRRVISILNNMQEEKRSIFVPQIHMRRGKPLLVIFQDVSYYLEKAIESIPFNLQMQ